MSESSADAGMPRRRILIIGQGRLVDAVRHALDEAGVGYLHLHDPPDREIRRELTTQIEAVVVTSRDDRISLRWALVVEAVRPGVRLIVTIYNRDLGAQLVRAVRNVRVMSMADIAAPVLAAACLADDLLTVRRPDGRIVGVRAGAEGPEAEPLELDRPRLLRRVLAGAAALLHPFELSAKTLLAGLAGFLLILVADATVVAIALHETLPDAVYSATKTIVTVGSNEGVDSGPAWLKVFSAAMMLAALGFTAVFTAGLIDRLLGRRLVAVLGPRTMPRSDHVVVVGLGQVGLRLCMLLRELGIPVVAVEEDPDADNIRRAKQYAVPVVLGRGSSRAVLRRLSLGRARAVAAVTSDEIENISSAMAALAVHADLRTVLRAGTGHVMDETRALFRIGAVRNVYRLGGTLIAAAALGSPASEAFIDDEDVFVLEADGEIAPFGVHVAGLPAMAAA